MPDPDLMRHGADQLRKERRENGWCEHDQPPEHCRRCHPELGLYPEEIREALSRAVVGGLVDSWSESTEPNDYPNSRRYDVVLASLAGFRRYTQAEVSAFADAVYAAERAADLLGRL